MRCVHYVGFRGDEFSRAHRVFGGPIIIHMVMDDNIVWTEVGPDDVVVIGPKGHTHSPFVWDASAVPHRYTD